MQLINVLEYIGNAYILLGELEQGIQAREVALHFAEKLFGLRHGWCSKISAALSFSYLRLGKFTKSIAFAKKAESAIQSHSTFEHTCKYINLLFMCPQSIPHTQLVVSVFHMAGDQLH